MLQLILWRDAWRLNSLNIPSDICIIQTMLPLQAKDPLPTRYSLLSRLQNWEDWESWKVFFDTYWRLIYSVAIKSGLSETEAQDVVQETIICVAKNIQKFKRDGGRGSFKGWLRNLTRWRIGDQFRKRTGANWRGTAAGDYEIVSSEMVEIPDPAGFGLETVWDDEWQANLLEAAMERVKLRVKEEHYQMFDLYVVKGWPVDKVAGLLGVSVARIYLAKHRVSTMVKKEIRLLEKKAY
ncbi:MAG: polymerase, sigma-24 subunit, subfamily [Pedosphaera sp.]|nr:polymerase, sigma-24 subunit, subfamily [Pedosphaera sp.]